MLHARLLCIVEEDAARPACLQVPKSKGDSHLVVAISATGCPRPDFFRKVRHFCVPLSAPIVMSKLLVFRVRNQRAVIANYPDRSEFNWRRGLGKQLVVFWCSAARASAAIGTTPSTEREQPAEVATFTATPYWLHAIPLYCCVSSSILRWDKLVRALASEAQCRAATGALVMLKPRS